jgi:hypothetical protein
MPRYCQRVLKSMWHIVIYSRDMNITNRFAFSYNKKRFVSPFTLMNVQWLLMLVNVSVRNKQGVASSKYIRVKGCT